MQLKLKEITHFMQLFLIKIKYQETNLICNYLLNNQFN